ncbi:transcriptional regulator with XRE-family HTH domain [Hamadaea flava]|uniref:Helix-turn-helix domain-containing protein n=1 Tax=Hamadaea flava TaxID=1742688 RepID=A0ABV8M0N6_9ACTN|nr:helix-turn-helix transcriptional regulator [Hamadaea flava]MCP2328445.1 transcriptional regulator with XRE-family HTH domain [Hamadaea flava]
MPRAAYRSRRAELAAIRADLTDRGATTDRIAAIVRARFNVNSRVAYRQALGLTQQRVADRWNQLFPSDRPVTHKQISYWEAWPSASGRPPSIEDLNKLAQIYQCSAAALLDGADFTAYDAVTAVSPEAATAAVAVGDRTNSVQPIDIVSRVDAVISSSGSHLVANEADYQRLVQELIEWAQRMHRRDILHWLSFAAAAAAAAPVLIGLDPDEQERTVSALASPSRVDDNTIDHIEAVLWRCMRQDDTLGPAAALETTLAQRSLVRSLLPAVAGITRDRLLSLYANLLRFAGWLSFDLNDFDSANTYFEHARTAAHEAHNTELGALVLCNMSHLATWRGQPRTGIDHALAAGGWAMRTEDDHLRAYAFDVAARAYAMDGQQTAALSAIESARTIVSNSAGSPTGLVYFYNVGQLASTESTCHLYLGSYEHGATVAEQALADIDPTFVRNLALTSLRLGVCRMRAAKPDISRAAQAMTVAVQLASHNQSARLIQRLRRGTKELAQWTHVPEVRQVSEQMVAYGLTT